MPAGGGEKKKKFRFKNKLVSLEGRVIDLCATLYDGAKFRRSKGGVKLHLLLDHDGDLPRYAVIEPAQKSLEKRSREGRARRGVRNKPTKMPATRCGFRSPDHPILFDHPISTALHRYQLATLR